MKKTLAILLALVFALSLCSCASQGSTTSPSASNASASNASASNASGDASGQFPKEAGYFDAAFDYSKFEKFKVGYLVAAASPLWDEFANAYKNWADRMNINFTGMWTPSANSADEYLSGLQTFVDQGYDGLILDPDVTIYPRIVEILKDTDVQWVSGLGQARDYAGTNVLYHPNVGFDNTQVGIDIANKLVEWKDATWKDVPWEKVGYIVLDFSLSPEIHQRELGAEQRWAELHPEFGAYDPAVDVNPKNFFIADVATGNMDQTTAQNLATQILSNPGDIEVWLIATAVDDYSVGAANAADALHITDKVQTIAHGGVSLPARWDSGIDDSWRAAYFCSQSIYTEPIICQLWSYMAGQATPDTLWPEWIDINDNGDVKDAAGNVTEEHSYAVVKLPLYFLEKDTYKTYLEWTDLYAYGPGAEGRFKYDVVTDINMFPSRGTVPASYSVKNP